MPQAIERISPLVKYIYLINMNGLCLLETTKCMSRSRDLVPGGLGPAPGRAYKGREGDPAPPHEPADGGRRGARMERVEAEISINCLFKLPAVL